MVVKGLPMISIPRFRFSATPSSSVLTIRAETVRIMLMAAVAIPLLSISPKCLAKTPIEDALEEACQRLAQANQNNLTSGQLLLRERCIALNSLRNAQGESAYQAVLKKLSPDQATGQQRTSRNDAHMQMGSVGSRMSLLRTRQNVPGQNLGMDDHQNESLIGASAGDDDVSRFSGYLNGSTNLASKGATTQEPEYDTDANSVTAGVDYRLSPQWVIGAALGQTRANTDFAQSRGSIDTDGNSVIAYAAFSIEGLSLDMVLGNTDTSSTTVRNIDYFEDVAMLERVQAKPESEVDSQNQSIYLAADYQWQSGAWSYGPSLAVESIKTDVDAYAESQGGGFAIGFAPQSDRLTRYELGVRLSRAISQSWGVWVPALQVGVNHYQQSTYSPVVARLLFDELQTRTFELKSDSIDQDFQRVSLDVSTVIPHGLSAFFSFEQYFGYEDLDISTLTLGARAEF